MDKLFIIFQVWSPSHSLKTLRKKLLDPGEETKTSELTSSTQTTAGDTLEDKYLP